MSRAVVDQPGLKIVFLGLIISLFFGLSLRSQIRSSRVKHRLEVALQRLEKDIKVDFDQAEIQLSEWGWPRPYVVIHDIRIRPLRESCQETQLYIENLSFPVDWDLAFGSRKVISSLRLTQAELRLGDLSKCLSPQKTAETTVPVPIDPLPEQDVAQSAEEVMQQISQKVTGTRTPANVFTTRTSAELKQIKIDRLKIISKDNYQKPIDLRAMTFNFFYEKKENQTFLQKIDVQTRLQAFHDPRKEIYMVKSDLKLEVFSQDGNINAQGQINGKLLDRSFSVNFKYDPEEQELLFLHDFKSLSLKALAGLFEDSILMGSDLQNSITGFVISLYGGGRYNFKENSFKEYTLKKINIKSENSSVEIHEIDIQSLNPVRFKPFEIYVSRFDLTRFGQLNSLQDIAKSIERFGEFSGSITVKSKEDFNIKGFVQNTVVIFSNQGVRALQPLDSFNLNLVAHEKGIDFKLGDFIRNKKKITGDVSLSQRESITRTPEVHAQVNLSGQLFDPQVTKIFFSEAYEPEVGFRMKYQSENNIQAEVSFDKIVLDGVQVNSPMVKYSKNLQSNIEKYQARASSIHFDEELVQKNELFQSLFQRINQSGSFDLFQPNATLEMNRRETGTFVSKAEVVGPDKSPKQFLTLEGVVSNRDQIAAQVSLRRPGKSADKFGLVGNVEKLDFKIER